MIYLLTAIGLPTGGSSTIHLHTNNTHNDKKQTIHRTKQKLRTTQKFRTAHK